MKFASDRFIARQLRKGNWKTAHIHWTSVTTDVQVVAVGPVPVTVYVLVGDKAPVLAATVRWQLHGHPEDWHRTAIAAGIRLAKHREAAIEHFAHLVPTRQGTP